MKARIWLGIPAIAVAFLPPAEVQLRRREHFFFSRSSTAERPCPLIAGLQRHPEIPVPPGEWKRYEREGSIDVIRLFNSLPPSSRGPAMNAWFEIVRPGDGGDETELRVLLEAWAEKDFAAAERWARALSDPSARERATILLSGAIAEEHPYRAFDCLAAHGDFSTPIYDHRIEALMTWLSREAMAAGGDALLTLWRRLPQVHDRRDPSSRPRIDLDPPPGTDIGNAMENLNRLRDDNRDGAMVPLSPMPCWNERDPRAATKYVVDQAILRSPWWGRDWSDLQCSVRRKDGQEAARRWTLEFFRQLPADLLPEALARTMGTPCGLLRELPEDISPADRDRLMLALVKILAERGSFPNWRFLLDPTPQPRDLYILRCLRGMTLPGPIIEWARDAGASDTQLIELRALITQPW